MFKQIFPGIVLVILVCFSNQLCAQKKLEKESRLRVEDVPAKAAEFIDSLNVKKRIKWYLEEGLDNTSIEAKFDLDDQKFSVEFDSIGNLEDIEIQIEWKDLRKSFQDSIRAQLGEACIKFKIKKVQIQYSGTPSALLSKIRKGESTDKYVIKYEIVVKCCNKQNVALFEYLFNETGQILAVTQFVFKNSSNLEY